MRTLRYVVCDVFTDRPLTGDQLAVFTDASELDAATMQALALEIGFSETAFVLPPERDGHARIRIFNSRHEMAFAGHPTLGTAFVLAALAVPGSEVPVELYDNGATHVFVALPGEDDVAALEPAIPEIARLGLTGVNCFAGGRAPLEDAHVLAGRRGRRHARSSGSSSVPAAMRMFWPDGEDAATGSAAGPLACHLCRHGLVEWGVEIEISQGEEIGRPSRLFARAEGHDGVVERVTCGGSAVVVARGAFCLSGPSWG